jgi:hypothetical protein
MQGKICINGHIVGGFWNGISKQLACFFHNTLFGCLFVEKFKKKVSE